MRHKVTHDIDCDMGMDCLCPARRQLAVGLTTEIPVDVVEIDGDVFVATTKGRAVLEEVTNFDTQTLSLRYRFEVPRR